MEDEDVADVSLGHLAWLRMAAGVLSKDVAGLAQWASNERRPARASFHVASAREQRELVVSAVHGGAHEIIEAGVDQREVIVAHGFRGPYLGEQHACLGREIATGLDLEIYRVTEVGFDPAARVVPNREVRARVDRRFALAIRNR